MARWEPDAAGRLRTAALELFATAGFEETTVGQIAERAGVTARTFFRYFADKPEVLFAGSENFEPAVVASVLAVSDEASARTALDAGLATAAALVSQRPDFARQRTRIIRANAALTERETMKMAKLTEGLAEALRTREVPDPDAAMLAHAGVAAFRLAFAAWVEDPSISLEAAIGHHLDALAGLVR